MIGLNSRNVEKTRVKRFTTDHKQTSYVILPLISVRGVARHPEVGWGKQHTKTANSTLTPSRREGANEGLTKRQTKVKMKLYVPTQRIIGFDSRLLRNAMANPPQSACIPAFNSLAEVSSSRNLYSNTK